MASTRRLVEIPLNGFDRAQASHKTTGKFYDLLQLRPQRGKLTQTDPTILHLSTSAAQVRFNDLVRNANGSLRYLTLTESDARLIDPVTPFSQVTVPIVLQIAVPNQSDDHGECLLYGISTLDFGAANDQIDITIVDATHFKWRKNAGSWSDDLVIGVDIAIGTALKVSFMLTTGFTASDTWSWKRTTYPYTGADATTVRSVPKTAVYKSDIYIAGVERNILRMRSDVITSVGYKRAYGKYVAVFNNHLVIAQYAAGIYSGVTGVADSYVAADTPWVIGWSHLDNPDQLYATDLNEADEYSVPTTSFPDTTVVGITGMAQRGQLMFIYLPDDIMAMRYLGLPLVMQIDPYISGIGSRFSNGLVVTPKGHYFVGSDDIYFFDGTFPRAIGEAVREKFFSEMVASNDTKHDQLFGYYDRGRDEISWTYWVDTGAEYQCRQVIFQERDNQWFFRNVPDIRCQGRLYQNKNRSTYGHSTGVLRDFITGDAAASIVEDLTIESAANGFTQPLVESHVMSFGDVYKMKDVDGMFIDAAYTTSNGVQLAVSIGDFIDTLAAFSNKGRAWVPSRTERKLDFQAVAGRSAKFRLTFTGTKPVGCSINNLNVFATTFDAEK